MYFRQLRLPDIGCASYIIGGDGVCAVVDPRWDAVRQYIGLARQQGLQITHIIETHTHADHVSGATRLAARTGARVLIHRSALITYPHEDLDDGDVLTIGPSVIRVMHTPGHSADSISLLVEDPSGAEPSRLLSGDTLFVGEIGRPDLHGSEATPLAEMLFSSLHERVLRLDGQTEVYPGHLAGSLCGKRIAPDPSTTIGRERKTNPTLAIPERRAFVQSIIEDLPPRPPNVTRIVSLNRAGAPEERPTAASVAPAAAREALANAVVVDGRDVAAFARGHLKGAINAPISYGQFGVMVAWMLPPDVPLVLIAQDDEDLADAIDSLMVVGMTNPLARLEGTPEDWAAAGLEVVQTPMVAADDLSRMIASGQIGTIVDAREAAEAAQGMLSAAVIVPYREMGSREALPPLVEPVVTVCNSGNRSGLAASLLERQGVRVVNLIGGTTAWEEAGLPLVRQTAAVH